MLLKVLLALCYVLFFVFVPLYDKAYWPEPTKKSLSCKMVAATSFVGIGFIGIELTGNESYYANMMLIGLILGWVGDLFMHIPHPPNNPRMSVVYIGASAFLVGHIFYVLAFVKSAMALTPDYKFFTIPEIVAFIVIFLAFALTLEPVFKFNYKNTFMKVTLHLYSIFLIIMLLKSCAFGVTYYLNGAENSLPAMIILLAGAIFFFISDFTLGLRLIGGAKGNKTVKTVSLYAYFIAQLLLATSILFVHI